MDLQKTTARPGLQANTLKDVFRKRGVQQITIGLILFVIIYSLVASSIVPQKYNLSEGDVALTDIPSPKEVIDVESTNVKIEEAIKEATKEPPRKTDDTVKQEAVRKVDDFFNQLDSFLMFDEKIRAEKFKELAKREFSIELSDEDCSAVLAAGGEELTALQENIKRLLIDIFDKEIENDDKEVSNSILVFQNDMNSLKLKKELISLGAYIGKALIKPNQVIDHEEMNRREEEARNSVEPVKVKKNQNIVKKGEVVTKGQIAILKSLGLLEQQKEIDILLYLGIGILVAMLEWLVIIYMFKYSPDILRSSNKLILLSVIVLIVLLIAKVASVFQNSGYIVPLAFAAMLVSVLLQPRLALVLNIALSGFVTLMTGYNIDTFIVAIIGGSAGAIIVSRTNQRNELISAGLLVSLINALTLLGIGFMTSTDIILVLKLSLLGILNGALSSILAIGILPICEATFGIVTSIKLLELSNPNQPVLKRLLYEAPGTYHHSIIVGNLAEAAVDVIGGNSLLARVGSYYHDIGKLKRPYFFKENQLTSDNPHDKIAPSLSTLIITNHVKDGVEIARKYKLPGIIKDMVEQHHGTTLVKYFYYKAVNGSDTHDDITETQFRYEGPKPTTRETAVVMLADSIEAAVRSISSPTKPKIEEMVNKVIKEKISDGQLDDSDLTLKDINRITIAFLNVLTGIYHDRIEYPEMVPGSKGGSNNDADGRE